MQLAVLISFSVQAQHTLSGIVTDSRSNEPLPQASLYLPELQRGLCAQSDGGFIFPDIPGGKLLLEISHLGYKTKFLNISVPCDSLIRIQLEPSVFYAKEVVVTGYRSQAPQETTFTIAQLTRAQLNEAGAFSIADALTSVPGVSQLTTGAGISKPVLRGLYGNRIQVNVNGLRFDNQQWQDEHGLGLSDIGIDRLEIIRGPVSVLYGSDALGGVINVIEERPAPVNSRSQDVNFRLYSNTYGMSLNYGYKKSSANEWKKIRAGFDSHGDYSDGKNNRILNSRFASYNLKAGWGKNKANSIHVVNVASSYSLFGFVFDSLSRKREDGRLSRSFDGPHHIVSYIQATSENTYFRDRKEIKFNIGATSNLRMEDEGGGGISLSMLLNSANALIQVIRPVGFFAEWVYGGSIFAQTNTNFGGRIIIPNALSGEASAFGYYKFHRDKWLLEGGIRYDKKLVETFATKSLNVTDNDSPTQEIIPFTRFYNAFNFSAGAARTLIDNLQVKLHASSGYRPGNLAELSSNGLHEGTLRWEIGMPNARIEQNLNVESSVLYTSSCWHVSASVYSNYFRNYIYLEPTGTEYYGFSVYHFQQTNANIRGMELSSGWRLPGIHTEWDISYSSIQADKSNGEPLPFIPANKITSMFRQKLPPMGKFQNVMIHAGSVYVFDQNRPAAFETSTKSYLLIQAGIQAQCGRYQLSLTGNNLLNKLYYDHLSRFKYYGIANMGRSIVFGLNFKF
ncbi:MAG TPA: TonB-dependent receptor [Ohtaekwangia sp.]|uniref:TonB-dependent receptor n=1 Tax=Ohtaekwangia sp. TaxID=2066019 RepID=UPI002F9437F3